MSDARDIIRDETLKGYEALRNALDLAQQALAAVRTAGERVGQLDARYGASAWGRVRGKYHRAETAAELAKLALADAVRELAEAASRARLERVELEAAGC